jgi:hypothetical protein
MFDFIYKWLKRLFLLTRSSGARSLSAVSNPEETVVFFECFPYVCPEPVLVKRSHLYVNGVVTTVFA